jgi:hypothetical protein
MNLNIILLDIMRLQKDKKKKKGNKKFNRNEKLDPIFMKKAVKLTCF